MIEGSVFIWRVRSLGGGFCKFQPWFLIRYLVLWQEAPLADRPDHRVLLQVATVILIMRMAHMYSPTAFQATRSNLESNPECDPFLEMPGVWKMDQYVLFQIFPGKDDYRNHLKVTSTEMSQDLVRTNTQWFYQPVLCWVGRWAVLTPGYIQFWDFYSSIVVCSFHSLVITMVFCFHSFMLLHNFLKKKT